jgi:hypothetical protein
MASVSATQGHSSENVTWDNLKRAIASSSGFQRWRAERTDLDVQSGASLDQLVSRYLRETLETLAY